MKRNQFLKLTGFGLGVTLLGCHDDVVSELLPEESYGSLSIADSKEWFENTYLKTANLKN